MSTEWMDEFQRICQELKEVAAMFGGKLYVDRCESEGAGYRLVLRGCLEGGDDEEPLEYWSTVHVKKGEPLLDAVRAELKNRRDYHLSALQNHDAQLEKLSAKLAT